MRIDQIQPISRDAARAGARGQGRKDMDFAIGDLKSTAICPIQTRHRSQRSGGRAEFSIQTQTTKKEKP